MMNFAGPEWEKGLVPNVSQRKIAGTGLGPQWVCGRCVGRVRKIAGTGMGHQWVCGRVWVSKMDRVYIGKKPKYTYFIVLDVPCGICFVLYLACPIPVDRSRTIYDSGPIFEYSTVI